MSKQATQQTAPEFLPEMTFRAQDREFRIESVHVVVKDNDDQPDEEATHIYAFRVNEGDNLLNIDELLDMSFDFFDNPTDAVDGGFAWLRRYLKSNKE